MEAETTPSRALHASLHSTILLLTFDGQWPPFCTPAEVADYFGENSEPLPKMKRAYELGLSFREEQQLSPGARVELNEIFQVEDFAASLAEEHAENERIDDLMKFFEEEENT